MATNPDPDRDCVEQASLDSFPASDPPAWGSSHAAPSESTVCPPELLTATGQKLRTQIVLGVAAVGTVFLVLEVVRRVRAR